MEYEQEYDEDESTEVKEYAPKYHPDVDARVSTLKRFFDYVQVKKTRDGNRGCMLWKKGTRYFKSKRKSYHCMVYAYRTFVGGEYDGTTERIINECPSDSIRASGQLCVFPGHLKKVSLKRKHPEKESEYEEVSDCESVASEVLEVVGTPASCFEFEEEEEEGEGGEETAKDGGGDTAKDLSRDPVQDRHSRIPSLHGQERGEHILDRGETESEEGSPLHEEKAAVLLRPKKIRTHSDIGHDGRHDAGQGAGILQR